LAFGLLLAAGPAAAECDADNAIFDDDFEFLDPSWGAAADNFYVENGVLVAKSYWGQVNLQTQNEAANVCVDAKIVDAPAPENSPLGVIWWWENWDNYYYLYYWSDQPYLEVRRVVKGQSQTIYSQETLAVKKGAGQTNHIEVDLRAKDATVIVNGTQVTRFKGKPPKGGGSVGIYVNSPEDKPATYEFDNFIVSPPS
jgi:hypothetical protein